MLPLSWCLLYDCLSESSIQYAVLAMRGHEPDAGKSLSAKSMVQKRFGGQSEEYNYHGLLSDRGNLDTIIKLAEISPADRVLDVGTGTGWLAAALSEIAGELVASDLTAEMLHLARIKVGNRKNVSFVLADAENLPFSDSSFDVVTCRVAVHHIPRPRVAFTEMARVCSSMGRVVIMDIISSEDEAKSEYHNQMERLRDPSHIKEYRKSELEEMIVASSLEIAQAQLWPFTWSVDEWLRVGGPGAAAEEKIRAMMLDSLEHDKSGTNLELKEGRLFFTYTTAIFVAMKAGWRG